MSDAEADAEVDHGGSTLSRLDADDVARYLQWGGLALLVLFALVASVGVYTSVGHLIELWVTERFQPLFSAAWNLAVLLASLAGIAALLGRLR